MNRPIASFLSASLLVAASATALAEPPDAQWKQVYRAIKKGLATTAIKHLDPIIERALQDKAYARAIKAIGTKIALEGNIQGNKPEERVVRMKAEIAKAPDEMKPVMEAILANWYWHYFESERWRIIDRTTTEEPPGADFATWDVPRLFAEIDKHFSKALAAREQLKAIPVARYNDLLEKGNMPDTYRPTLFDFVAHNALAFYTCAWQAWAKPQDAFEIRAEGPIFEPAADFVKWRPETTDQDSPKLKAVRLYQQLLEFHQDDVDRAAWLDANLARLEFGHTTAVGEKKNARYKSALKRFVDQCHDHPISARARCHWAKVLREEKELVAAQTLASQGSQAFPESIGGRMCFNLVQAIEQKTADISTERVWNEPWPTIRVVYRNVDKVYFRAVPFNFEKRLKAGGELPEDLGRDEKKVLLKREPALGWAADLPATDDYQTRSVNVLAPRDLKPGSYFLIASHDPSFAKKDNKVSYAAIWISKLALVPRIRDGWTTFEGFVLDARTGDPIAGAQVRSWSRKDESDWTEMKTVQTDDNGLFRVRNVDQREIIALASHQGQQLATHDDYHLAHHDDSPRPFERTFFFTDRTLYRPGQTIHYKGISIRVDRKTDDYETIPGHELTVILSDVNGKLVARQQHKTNDHGSFSGSFTAPRNGLTGRMWIQVEGDRWSNTHFYKEEYKRPKFLVTLDAPKTAARLGGKVALRGRASAYTGAAVDRAKVRWQVVRQVSYPEWRQWRCWWDPPSPQDQAIASGHTITGRDGSFPIEFTAQPDLSVSEKDEPTFRFLIHVDVTDSTGETRSTMRVVNLGYTALQALLTAPTWLTDDKPVKIDIRTDTLDGEPQQAKGSLKIYQVRQPEKVVRAKLSSYHRPLRWNWSNKNGDPPSNPADPNSWPLGDVVAERAFSTVPAGNATCAFQLASGLYRVELETQDRYGKPVTALLPLRVVDPDADKLAIKLPNLVDAAQLSLQPGDELTALWGSGYERARAFVEIEHRGKLLQSYWTDPDRTQIRIKQEVTEAMRGGFTVHVTMVRENRAYIERLTIDVPWTNKQLDVRWEHFVSKLQPGEKETWTAVVTGPDAKRAVAEMVATLYDESLDAYRPHRWKNGFGMFRSEYYPTFRRSFENLRRDFDDIHDNWRYYHKSTSRIYRAFPYEVTAYLTGYDFFSGEGGRGPRLGDPVSVNGIPGLNTRTLEPPGERRFIVACGGGQGDAAPPQRPDLSQVAARKNLNETAFFFPHLTSNANGEVRLEFSMPEALTKWRFLGFAHDRQLRAGLLTDSVVTAKDLMVQPNPPRFLREGDELEFTVKVSNQSAARQSGLVQLTLADARTGENVDQSLGNSATQRKFDIPPKESRSYSWRLNVPDGMGFLTYKTVGSTGKLSDGEEGYLPVLSRRILMTESLPLPVRGPATKRFEFSKLLDAGKSDTLKHQSLTVQMVSNPAWYAVTALPYLMEYPHECSEQVFNRLYANSLARHIANSDPKIRRVFDQWKDTPALDSPLEKNEDLKAVMLEETPWVCQAQSDSQARRNLGHLFDDNRLNRETVRTLHKLVEMQRDDGRWPWFPGGPGDEFITLYITTGCGRLRHLGVDIGTDPAAKSLAALDAWIDGTYRETLRRGNKNTNHLSHTIAFYLYGRSFFLADKPIDPEHKEAIDYFLGQARKYWLELACRQSQAHLAIALKRFGNQDTPQDIMRSIKQRSVSDEELGMFWRDTGPNWRWHRAPIETQAMMIEAFDEVMGDVSAVNACRVWLLRQKQTQDWKTTKATADAIYGLLLRGDDVLASNELVEVTLADLKIEPENVEAGTGFYERRFVGSEIMPRMGEVTMKKVDEGVAWGSIHWQYLEDMSKVTPYEVTPLKLEKKLFVKQYTTTGSVLKSVGGPLAVGDELVVRIVLRTDRDMEYVHMKDQRGSGTEPVNVLSQYKYQDGLYYYESTRDTASHFFVDFLPKGVYVFEYSLRLQHKGRYQTGPAQIQCMYAPEFSSHSESFDLEVK